MKRPLILAAAMAASTLTSTLAGMPALASPGDTGNFGSAIGITKGTTSTAGVMMINAPTVQSFAFSNGTDTNQLQYSASAGQTNQFSVGASNNAGINSSVSSTAEYTGTSSATLALAAGCEKNCPSSQLTNVLGVAEQAYNTSARSESYAAAAAASAQSSASYKADAEVGASFEARANRSQTTAEYEAAYKASYEAEYNSSYSVAYAAASAGASSSERGVVNSTGTVGGDFNSTTNGVSTTVTTTSGSTTTTTTTSEMQSTSNVELAGVGANSTIAAGSNSLFETDIVRNSGATGTQSDLATANASAGVNLGTNASASSNASSFSSVFINAF